MQKSALRAYQSGDDARAEALYLGLIHMAPNDPENLLRLGNLYARNGKPDRAAETYMQALLLNPGDTRLWYNLGLVRKRQSEAAMLQVMQLTADDDPMHAKARAALEKCLQSPAAKTPKQHEQGK
jgi:tetratricopeptide (TPR) repeat protein